MLTFRSLPVVALLSLSACGAKGPQVHDFQIVVSGSATPVPVNFTGSYACSQNGEERIMDISGSGTLTTSFECAHLSYVRVQRVLGEGLVSLTVYKDGRAVYTTPPTDSTAPISYVPER